MGKLISGWTDAHVPVALALVVAAAAGAVALVQPGLHPLLGAGAVVATALVALFLDAFGGLVAGVVAAAAVVLAKQLTAVWTTQFFVASLAQVVTLIALGWLTGMVSTGVHGRRAGLPGPDAAAAPAYGSLGLLSGDVALARLDEEVARARRHDRPLAVAVFRVVVVDEGLDERARDAAFRAVARLVETLLRETDVPFALGEQELGAILPETDEPTAWEVLGPLLDAATRAAFTVREDDERRSLVDTAELHTGLAVLGDRSADPAVLLQAARTAARDEAEASPNRYEADRPAPPLRMP